MMTVIIKKEAIRSFQEACKLGFPCERYGILIGKTNGKAIYVNSVYIPENQASVCTEFYVHPKDCWYDEAVLFADSLGESILGDIHSHCYADGEPGDTSPSFPDWTRTAWIKAFSDIKDPVFGIMCLTLTPKRRKRIRTSFWPAIPPLKTKVE